MPLATILFAYMGFTLKDLNNKPYKKKKEAAWQ